MNRPVTVAVGVACVVGLLVLAGALSRAQEAKQGAQSTLVATIDLSPIQSELAALRNEVVALKQAVADPKGLRDELAQAAAATKALDARLAALAEVVQKEFQGLRPVVVALDPATVWEYQWLRTRSEQVINRWARDGWQMVTAAGDWLYFRRPLVPGRKYERPPEAERGNE